MHSSSSAEQAILANVSAESPLITATYHQCSEWKRRYLAGRNVRTAATPPIFSWAEWLRNLTRQSEALPVALTPMQEQLLWEKIIEADLKRSAMPHHISHRGLARRACEAYALMQAYRIDEAELAWGGDESEALARWTGAMQTELGRERFKGRGLAADLVALLTAELEHLTLPRSITLDGFESITPADRLLLDRLESLHCKVATSRIDRPATTPTVVACADTKSEIRHLALRVKALLESDPASRIAIALPGASDHQELRRELKRILLPDAVANPLQPVEAVEAQGTPLSDQPMIRQTLLLLDMAGKTSLSFRDFSPLLFCPWLAGFDEERTGRAELDARLRRLNRHHVSLPRLLQSDELDSLPALTAVLQQIGEWEVSPREAGRWIKETHGLLQSIGIVQAGLESQSERSDNEIRLMNRFRDALTSLAAVDAVYGKMTWKKFLSLLHSACSESLHAVPPIFPNIVMLPLARVAGVRFDHLLIPGMDEQAFPPAAQPQPLLPLALQRKYRLPMSSNTLQFHSAEWLWQQILQAAPNIEISHARQRDEQELRPSPFLRPFTPISPLTPAPAAVEALAETFSDDEPVPLRADEQPAGGSRIIQDQSDCPFRAFVSHRLGISALGTTVPGIEATTKGSLVHLALEHIWRQLRRQQALLDLDTASLQTLIGDAVEHAWRQCRSTASGDKQQATERFEKRRMQRLLARWLEHERQRPPFEVAETEKRFQLHLPEDGEIKFSLRLTADRIDRIDDGRSVLLDYKTGQKEGPAQWLGERMEKPQLPLYAMAAGLRGGDAVAYASLRSGNDMGFEGLCGEATGIDGIAECDGKYNRPADWDEVLHGWRGSINALAREFAEGRSDVAPRNGKACTYCTFEALCRVEESGFEIDSEDRE